MTYANEGKTASVQRYMETVADLKEAQVLRVDYGRRMEEAGVSKKDQLRFLTDTAVQIEASAQTAIVEGLLVLAEQQRISNLIALGGDALRDADGNLKPLVAEVLGVVKVEENTLNEDGEECELCGEFHEDEADNNADEITADLLAHALMEALFGEAKKGADNE